jgi:hypothetical protein
MLTLNSDVLLPRVEWPLDFPRFQFRIAGYFPDPLLDGSSLLHARFVGQDLPLLTSMLFYNPLH